MPQRRMPSVTVLGEKHGIRNWDGLAPLSGEAA